MLLTDSLIERELNDFQDSPDKKSNSTIHELNSKLDEVFKSSEMKIKSINFNNDSTTLCSRKILGHQDKGKQMLYSSQQSKKLSDDGYLGLLGSTTSVQMVMSSSQKGRSCFKKKKSKRCLELIEKDQYPQLSQSKKKRLLQSSLSKQFPAVKRTLAKPSKHNLLQKLYKHMLEDSLKPVLGGKIMPLSKEMQKTRNLLAKRSLTETVELPPPANKEVKKSKHQKKASLYAKKKSYDASIQAFCQANSLKLPFDKRRSEVSKSIELNSNHTKSKLGRNSLALVKKRKSSPTKQKPNDHSLVTLLQSSVQSIPDNIEHVHVKLRKGKSSEIDLLDFQAGRQSKELSNADKIERIFAKKKSEPAASSNKKRGVFDYKKKSVELGKPLHLSHKAVLNCITELNSNRRSFTKDCIKNLIQNKKADQSATVLFRKKLSKGASSKVKARNNFDDSQVCQPDRLNAKPAVKHELERDIEKQVYDLGRTPHRRKTSKPQINKSDGLGSQYSIQHVWQHASKSKAKQSKEYIGGKSLKASFGKGPIHSEIIDLRRSKHAPYIQFDHSVKDILKYS